LRVRNSDFLYKIVYNLSSHCQHFSSLAPKEKTRRKIKRLDEHQGPELPVGDNNLESREVMELVLRERTSSSKFDRGETGRNPVPQSRILSDLRTPKG